MSNRIQELAYDAEELADFEDDNGSEFHAIFCRIFAKLIVQECIDYCGENLSKTVGGALKIHMGIDDEPT